MYDEQKRQTTRGEISITQVKGETKPQIDEHRATSPEAYYMEYSAYLCGR
ncbi:hypothetical protein KL86DYS2_10143 [uncultured Dysgonomonas sp.]|uniref:Uncharacterized protein n=1 Tax=uncultured Dysgonomonas sp. TaxID=206096 RepID=A0A212IVL5_9BACT|nr:hypothetical protein KL86DYS2_10143 [uncultured Dysgonomonas sp.]